MITALLLAAAVTGQGIEAVVTVGRCKTCGRETNCAIVAFKEADLRSIEDTIRCTRLTTRWGTVGGGAVKFSVVLPTTHVEIEEILPANGPAGNRTAWARVRITKAPVSLAFSPPRRLSEPLLGKGGFIRLKSLELLKGRVASGEEAGDLTFDGVIRPAGEWQSLWRRYAAALNDLNAQIRIPKNHPQDLSLYLAELDRRTERFCRFHRIRSETLAGVVRHAWLSSWPAANDSDKAAVDRLFSRLSFAWKRRELAEQMMSRRFLSALSGGSGPDSSGSDTRKDGTPQTR